MRLLEPIGQPGQGALKVGARDVLHEVNGAAAPVLGDVVEPLPQLRPLGESDVEPVSLPAVRLRFVLLEAQGVKTSGSGNARILSAVAFCCTSAFSARSRFRRSLSAVASAAFLAVRSLSAVRARAKDGAACRPMAATCSSAHLSGFSKTRGGTSISSVATGAEIWA